MLAEHTIYVVMLATEIDAAKIITSAFPFLEYRGILYFKVLPSARRSYTKPEN